jgi:N,N'-diacetyllegionaminate synthase
MKKPYIIAEAEINHNGSLKIAKKMVKIAKKCGADCIKFQYIIANEIADESSEYYPLFKKVELSQDEFFKLKEFSKKAGIDFMVTAPSVNTLKKLMELKVKKIKIGSSNLTNTILLREIAKHKNKIETYLSTGMGTLGEVETALKELGYSDNRKGNYFIFHCTANYPAEYENLNLRAIKILKEAFSDLEVGYSDHTIGSLAAISAATLGATFFEKHFTLDNKMKGPDHSFSTNPIDFKEYVDSIKNTIIALGRAKKMPAKSEAKGLKRGRRFLVLNKDIKKGEKFKIDYFDTKRLKSSVNKVEVRSIDVILKLNASKDYQKGQELDWRDF